MSYIPIGTIVNTHGLQGTLKVKSDTDFKEQRYATGSTLYIAFRKDMIPITVQSYRTVKGLDYLDVVEFTDINQCEQYKGSTLYIDQADQHDLDPDEYYYDQLIGLKVNGQTFTGTVQAVREVPRGELLVVLVNGKQVLIPFQAEFVADVDLKKGIITIIEWEGLL